MVDSPAMIIKDILEAANVGDFADGSAFSLWIAALPDKPDEAIAIYDSGGETPNPKWALDYPSVQVRLRGKENGYPALYDKVVAVRDALLGFPGDDLDDGRLVSVRMIGGAAFLGRDEKKRPSFTLNWSLILEPTPGAYREAL